MHKFKSVSPQVNFPELEAQILNYWKKNQIFEKSIESRPKNKTWTFLDGPPFITGLPHYGTLLSSIPKDLFPRFWAMKGYRVRRVWGWDCHGLPAENKVEDKLGLKRKRDIEEKVGVKKFIDECKLYVKDVSSEWEWYVEHIARWVDFKNAYKTMDLTYMETVMWVFKSMYEKGFIYKGLRVSLYCPHCVTPISNFEVAMDPDNYKSISEPGTTYKYQLKGEKNTYILAWSTTPWNKIATPALAINPKLTYVKIVQDGESLILAKKTLKMLKPSEYKIVREFPGQDLVGKKYVPHYDYYKIKPGKKSFIIVGGDFVTGEEGTGVVTIAAYGEEDLGVMQRENIHIEMHVDDEGNLKKDVPQWGGLYYLKVNDLVNQDLKSRGLIYDEKPVQHTVPTCWRCHTRLIYAPQDAWYIDVQKLKPLMKKTNAEVNWYPAHFKYGRFLKSMEGAPDWCISRSRFWGSPVPVWECECGHRFVPGSISDLENSSGQQITDLHKPDIDRVRVKCDNCGKIASRVPEVLDSWIEAGSAAFAERHFPFEKSQKLEDFFPPDFIVEYTGQIRAWFYVLHVIAAALYKAQAFKNVVVTGVILGSDGRKMSKNFGNYPDPKEMLSKYGGDALRLYLMGSPVMHGEDILISEDQYRNQVRGLMLILWNVYNFFVTYANVDGWNSNLKSQISKLKSQNILDRWILALLQQLIIEVTKALEDYDTVKAIEHLQHFIDDLSTWYIRRSRERVGPSADNDKDKNLFYETCFEILTTVCRLLAPFAPFISEEIYKNLTQEASVHLSKWPEVKQNLLNDKILVEMQTHVRPLIERVHAMRKKFNLKVRQPLTSLWLFGNKSQEKFRFDPYVKIILEELNIKKLEYHLYNEISSDSEKLKSSDNGFYLDINLTTELQKEGKVRDLVRQIQQLRKEMGCKIDEYIILEVPEKFDSYEDLIKRKALVSKIVWGNKLQFLTG